MGLEGRKERKFWVSVSCQPPCHVFLPSIRLNSAQGAQGLRMTTGKESTFKSARSYHRKLSAVEMVQASSRKGCRLHKASNRLDLGIHMWGEVEAWREGGGKRLLRPHPGSACTAGHKQQREQPWGGGAQKETEVWSQGQWEVQPTCSAGLFLDCVLTDICIYSVDWHLLHLYSPWAFKLTKPSSLRTFLWRPLFMRTDNKWRSMWSCQTQQTKLCCPIRSEFQINNQWLF